MAGTKKTATEKIAEDIVREKDASEAAARTTRGRQTKRVQDTSVQITAEAENGRLSLAEMREIVNTVVDSVFVERNGVVEFAGELYEALLAFMKIGVFYPNAAVLEKGLEAFFADYADGKYRKELDDLQYNGLAGYMERAVKQKVDARIRQIENPLIASVKRLVDAASVLAEKYVDDIDNVGSSDIKGFIENFVKLTETTNPDTVTDAVFGRHMDRVRNGAEDSGDNEAVEPEK